MHKELEDFDGDPLTNGLPIGYDGEVVDDVFRVMRLLRDARPIFYDKIALALVLPLNYVHLILEVLAFHNITEYGTSPRGSWLTDEGEELLRMAEAYRAAHPEEYDE